MMMFFLLFSAKDARRVWSLACALLSPRRDFFVQISFRISPPDRPSLPPPRPLDM